MTSILREAPSKTKKLYDDLAEIKAAFRYSDTSLWKEAKSAYKKFKNSADVDIMEALDRLPPSYLGRLEKKSGGEDMFYALCEILELGEKPELWLARVYRRLCEDIGYNEAADAFKDAVLNIDKTLQAYINALDEAQKAIHKNFEKNAEAEPQDALGSYAFAEERDDVPFEKDKAIERKLYYALDAHLDGNIPLSTTLTDLIKDSLKKGQYTKLFREPRVGTIYRGMFVREEWLRKALKIGKKEDIPRRGSQDASFTFTPRRGNASSWSSARTSATDFAWGSTPYADEYRGAAYGVILYAAPEDNTGRLLDVKELYMVDGLDSYQGEKEVIGIGKIKVFKVEWRLVNESDY